MAEEEAERLAIKAARKAANALKYKKADNNKAEEEAAKAEAKRKEEEEKKVQKELKRIAGKKYRETVKMLAAYCEEKMPGTKFDKFYVDELVKKHAK